MSTNPETLRLYARIMERPRIGDVPVRSLSTHGRPIPPGEITKACASALRFQADAIEKSNLAVVDLSAKMSDAAKPPCDDCSTFDFSCTGACERK